MNGYHIVESWKVGCVMKNPPFEITQVMLTDASEISELVGRLSAGKLSSSPILRRTNRIRTIQGTLAIEQNTLSLEQVTAVLNGRHVIAPPRDIAAAKNASTVSKQGRGASGTRVINIDAPDYLVGFDSVAQDKE